MGSRSAASSTAAQKKNKTLAAQFPDLRRFIREGYVRYAFTRFGIPYVVSIQCLDSAPRPKRLKKKPWRRSSTTSTAAVPVSPASPPSARSRMR